MPVAFGIETLPLTVLFDAAGVLAWRRDGAITEGAIELDVALEAALARE